ncbi:hypothetical protein KL864_33235 [Mycolicibacterium goodii]|uniref:hypothetical protein n=1 Tax=Mycolicibacterium goodii TaxID=134601 RepID=UPI001BDD29E6|nr:hypothetical protein [Mycolicibacterium goodii]MBU8820735.1 hypothetical protein [Mycolicibacterium goodii]
MGEAYPRPEGEAAQALVWAHWPSLTDQYFEDLIAQQQQLASLCEEHRDETLSARDNQATMLVGRAGEAHQEYMTNLAIHADEGKTHFDSKVRAAREYRDITKGVKIDLTRLANDAQKDWDAAKKVPGALGAVIATYAPEVESIIATAMTDLAAVIPPTPVPDPPKPANTGVQAVDNKTKSDNRESGDDGGDEKKRMADPAAKDGMDETALGTDKPYVNAENPGTGTTGDPSDLTSETIPLGGVDAPATMPEIPGAGQGSVSPMPSMPASPLGAGGVGSGGGGSSSGLGSVGSGGGSLASALKSSMPSVPSAGSAGTSPASSLPKMPSDNLVAGLSNAGSSFQSGVASGMGASGAVSPTAQWAQQSAAPMSPVQPVAVPSPAAGVAPGAGAVSVPDAPVGGEVPPRPWRHPQ